MRKYLDKSTGTADKYVHVSLTSFPVMTICPTYPYRIDALKDNGVETKSDIQFGAKWVSDKEGKSAEKFYEEVRLIYVRICAKLR